MPARLMRAGGSSPCLLRCDAQLGAAGRDDRARVSRAKGDGLLQASRAKENPRSRLDQERGFPHTQPVPRPSTREG